MSKDPIRAGEIVVFNVDVSHSFLVCFYVSLDWFSFIDYVSSFSGS